VKEAATAAGHSAVRARGASSRHVRSGDGCRVRASPKFRQCQWRTARALHRRLAPARQIVCPGDVATAPPRRGGAATQIGPVIEHTGNSTTA